MAKDNKHIDINNAYDKAKEPVEFEIHSKLDRLEFISTNQNGDYYFGFRIHAPRNINPKAKHKADELIIVGVPKCKLKKFLKGLLDEDEDHN